MIVAICAVAAIAVVFLCVRENRIVDENSKALMEEQAASEDVISNIQGNYTVHFFEDGQEVSTNTAYIIKSEDVSGYEIHVLSEYDPQVYILDVNSDAVAFSEELGQGTITYKPAIDKTVITLEKDNKKCEFIR